MRREGDAQEDSAARVNATIPWTVSGVEALPGHRLSVQFADGTRGEVDVSKLVFAENAGVFAQLRDPAAFAKVRVDRGVVSWICGVDLAPDAMYDAILASGLWTPE